MFVLNSRLGFSSATLLRSSREDFHDEGSSFFRSYGCNLPSSLTRVFSRTLGFSPCLPVSVLVRADLVSLEVFLGRISSDFAFPEGLAPHQFSVLSGGFAFHSTYRLRHALPFACSDYLLRHSVLIQLSPVSDYSPIVLRLCFFASA